MMLTLLILVIIPAFVAIPILIYHFLIFPNLDGVIQDFSWDNYDDQSQHFLYWVGFYSTGIFGAILGSSARSSDAK